MKLNILPLLFILVTNLFSQDIKQKVSVQLLWKHQFEFAGYYMAKEKGFYDDAGLDVDIKEFNFGINIIDDVEKGKTTFGISYPNIILEKSAGKGLILLNAILQSSPHILVSLKSSGIKSIKDFKNKKIMINKNAAKTASFRAMLKSNNITLDQMTKLEHTFNIEDLIEGKTDIITCFSSNELYHLDKRGIQYDIWDPKDYGFDLYDGILFTSNKTVKTQPYIVQKFQQATLKGWEYAFSNINESIKLILAKYNTQQKSKEALIYEANVLKEIAYKDKTPLGNLDSLKLKRIQDIYALLGLVKKDIDMDKFIFDSKKIYLTEEEKEFIKNTTLNVSVSKDWIPFSFETKDGKPSGISSDYWKLIKNKLGLKVKYQFQNYFSDQLENIKNKRSDIIFSTGKTKERETYSLFTDKYITFPISIVTRQNQNYIENFEEIKNKKIAVGNNFTAHKMLKSKYPDCDFILVNTIKDGLDMVNDNNAFAFIDIKPTLLYNINKLEYTNLKITGNTGLNFDLRIMIRDDYKILKSILDKTINSINNKEIDTIINKYENIQFQKTIDYSFLLKIFLFVGIVLLIAIYSHFILRRSNEKLKILVDEKTKELVELNRNLEIKIEKAVKENSQKDRILFAQSKMASMGEMIGNIAHQWRQPLSVISTSASGIQFKIENNMYNKEETLSHLGSLIDATKYLSQTIDDFQNFLKPNIKNNCFNIKDILNKNLIMFGKSFINSDIEFITNIEDVYVNGNENELLQVIINILNNSKDVLKEKALELEHKYIFIDLHAKDNNAVLIIKDNGGGVDKNILPKIFDAYFTTKHQSKGTGIGLYMSFQIISATFNGILEANNSEYTYKEKKYSGALFKITIPLSDKQSGN